MKPDDEHLSLDDPCDDALAETWAALDGTAAGATAFIEWRQTLRDIRALAQVTA